MPNPNAPDDHDVALESRRPSPGRAATGRGVAQPDEPGARSTRAPSAPPIGARRSIATDSIRPADRRGRSLVLDGKAEVGVGVEGVVARRGGDRDVAADAVEGEALPIAVLGFHLELARIVAGDPDREP